MSEMVYSSITLLHVNMMNTVDLNAFFLVVGVSISMVTLYLYCNFGAVATGIFLKYADCLYKMPW